MIEQITADLITQIRTLGKHGGSISESVYDTAHVLRFVPPPPEQRWPIVRWLLDQQQDDGGWNHRDQPPIARTAPTLAALLALEPYHQRQSTREAQAAGVAWLQRTLDAWASLPDDLPVGSELIVPTLIADAQRLGLTVPDAAMRQLQPVTDRRYRQIQALAPAARLRSTAMHSWEAWGDTVSQAHIDARLGLAASPAATAAWVARATAAGMDAADLAPAHAYLTAAAIPVTDDAVAWPTAWPMDDFERAYSVHTIVQTELHRIPAVRAAIEPHLTTLATMVERGGVGATHGFPYDGDDTAAAVATLRACGHHADPEVLDRYLADAYAVSYPGELQPSLITTARVAQALHASGHTAQTRRMAAWLAERQAIDGLWPTDKWNGDRRYVAAQVIAVFAHAGDTYLPHLIATRNTLLAQQHPDGGWGGDTSRMESTAYGVIALAALPTTLQDAHVQQAIRRAGRWMLHHYTPFAHSNERHWLAKDRYRPHRLARVIELCALLRAVSGSSTSWIW